MVGVTSPSSAEKSRDDREPFDLLEARPVAVDVVDDALDGRSTSSRETPSVSSSSSEMSATTYGRLSPITSACETTFDDLSAFSRFCGARFLPPAVTMMSFFRSVMRRKLVLVDLADVFRNAPTPHRVDCRPCRLLVVVGQRTRCRCGSGSRRPPQSSPRSVGGSGRRFRT